MSKIVLSYRRDDSRTITNWLYEKLVDRYGTDAIFRDIDSIQPTENFRKRIGRALKDCDFVIAVIGPGWHGPIADGQARINSANDWVRVEVETALQLDIPLLPVLVEDAEMPEPDSLPASLREITEINALPISSGSSRFYDDLNRLFATIDAVIGRSAGSEPAAKGPGAGAEAPAAPPPVTVAAPPAMAARERPANPRPSPSPEPVPASPAASRGGRSALLDGRAILLFIVVPGAVMLAFWLYAFEVLFDRSGEIAVFVIAGVFMLALGFVARRTGGLSVVEAAIAGAVIGAVVLVSVLAVDYLKADEFMPGFLVFFVGGTVATAAGALLGGLKPTAA